MHCDTSTGTLIIGFLLFNVIMQKQKNIFNSVKFFLKKLWRNQHILAESKKQYSSDGKICLENIQQALTLSLSCFFPPSISYFG